MLGTVGTGGSVTRGRGTVVGIVEAGAGRSLVGASESGLGGAGGMVIGAGGMVIGAGGWLILGDGTGSAGPSVPSALLFGTTVLISVASNVTKRRFARTTTSA